MNCDSATAQGKYPRTAGLACADRHLGRANGALLGDRELGPSGGQSRIYRTAPIALAVSSGVQSDAARPEAEPVGLCLALGHVKLKQVWFSLSATVRQRPSTFLSSI